MRQHALAREHEHAVAHAGADPEAARSIRDSPLHAHDGRAGGQSIEAAGVTSGFFAAINAGLVPRSCYGGGPAQAAPTAGTPPTRGARASAADFEVSAWTAGSNPAPVHVGSPAGDRMTIAVQTSGIAANATVRALTAAAQTFSVGYVQTIHHSTRRALYTDGDGTVVDQWVTSRGAMLDQRTDLHSPVPWYNYGVHLGAAPQRPAMSDNPVLFLPEFSPDSAMLSRLEGGESFTTYLVAMLGNDASTIVYLGNVRWSVDWSGHFNESYSSFSGGHGHVGGAARSSEGNAVLSGPAANDGPAGSFTGAGPARGSSHHAYGHGDHDPTTGSHAGDHARPFEYRPAERLDVVFSPAAPLEDIAAELYGQRALASQLVEIPGTPRAIRFVPTLLAPEWRATYYEHRAHSAVHAEVAGGGVIVRPTTGTLDSLVEAVVVFAPNAPAHAAADPAPAPAPAPPPAPAAAAPDLATTYDVTADYGAPVGELGDIADHPENFATVLGRADTDTVTVTIAEGGPFADLISQQMSQPMVLPRHGAPGFDPADPLHLAPLTSPSPGLVPALDTSPTLRVLDGHGVDPVALEGALATIGGAHRDATGTAVTLSPHDRLPVLVLDLTADAGVHDEGRFTIVGGSAAHALIGRTRAPTYVWRGHGALEPFTDLASLGDVHRSHGAPAAPGSFASLALAPDDPMAAFRSAAFEVTWVHYQVMTIAELRAIVRRSTVQRMLRSAEDDDHAPARVDRARLADLATGTAPVHGTRTDVEEHHEGVVAGTLGRTTTDAGSVPHTGATIAGVRDRFDIAEVMLRELIGAQPAIGELIRELLARVVAQRAELERAPERRDQAAQLIESVLHLVPASSRQIANIGGLFATYTNERSQHELREIRNAYSMALAFADQTTSAANLFDTANRRMMMFPLFDLDARGESDQDATDDALYSTTPLHDGSFLMGLDAHQQELVMQAFSRQASAHDFGALLHELALARAAGHTGDTAGAREHGALAAAIEQRMSGRVTILSQLHQALIAFDAFGRSSAAYTQMFTGDDERLRSLITRLEADLGRYEAASDDAARLGVLRDVAALWESDAAYQRFYAHVDQFIERSDFAVRLAITIGAGLLSMGVGSVAVGAGATAFEAMAYEAAAFTVADRSATSVLMPAASDAAHHEGSLGEYALGWGEDWAQNVAMMGIARGTGGMWRTLGRDMPTAMRMGGEMATTFAAFEAVGVAGHALTHHGELPTATALGDMTAQNAITLLVMTLISGVSRPFFEQVQIETAHRTEGGAARAMQVVEARRAELEARLRRITTATEGAAGSGPSAAAQRELARIQTDLDAVQAEARRILEGLDTNSAWARELAASEHLRHVTEALANRLNASIDVNRAVAFAARVGLRSATGGDGSYLLFNPGRLSLVRSFYEGEGYQVEVTQAEGEQTRLTVTRNGERLVLLEAREAVGEILAAGMHDQAATVHGGGEVHNHFNGVLHASDIVETLYGGDWQRALTELTARYSVYIQRRSRAAYELEARLASLHGAELQRAQVQLAELHAEIDRGRPAQQALASATPATAQRVVSDVLEASATTPFDVTYRARGALFEAEFAPGGPTAEAQAYEAQAARQLTEAAIQRLVADGVHDVEVQGRLPGSVTEAEFEQMCARRGVRIRFLRVVSTTEFSIHAAADPTTASTDADLAGALAEALHPPASGTASRAMANLASEIQAMPPALRSSVLAMLRSPSTVGIDIAGPERNLFTAGGTENLARLYRALRFAHEVVGREFVLRPHVGEGYDDVTAPPRTGADGSPMTAHAASEETARHNIDMVLAALRGIHYTPGNGVIIRFGHLTHASDVQLAELSRFGVIAEVNLGSNLATGSITAAQQHPLLAMLYNNLPVILSTDAGGVMRTSLTAEYETVERELLAPFRAGQLPLVVDGQTVRYDALPPSVQQRFTLAHLRATSEAYTGSIDRRAAPVAPPIPVVGAMPDDDREVQPAQP